MKPAYRDGDIIVVSPGTPIRRGDRVVVKTTDGEVMVKELKRRTAKTLELAVAQSGAMPTARSPPTTSNGSRGSCGRASRIAASVTDVLQRPAATFASHRAVRDRRGNNVRRRARLLRAPAEQVLEDPARDQSDAGAAAAASISQPAAASDRPDRSGEGARRGMDRATLPKLTAADRARLSDGDREHFARNFLAFTSKTAGQKFFDGKRDYGEQTELIGDTRVWILPSTSGAANGSWRPEIWHAVCGCGQSGGVTRFPSPLVGEGGAPHAQRAARSDEGMSQRAVLAESSRLHPALRATFSHKRERERRESTSRSPALSGRACASAHRSAAATGSGPCRDARPL